MTYKYKMLYEPQKESQRPPDGWYVIRRKPAGFFGLFCIWEFFALGKTQELALQDCERKLKDTKQTPVLIQTWIEY